MKINIKKLIFPLLFILSLCVVSAVTFLSTNNYSENEKRFLEPFPEFSWKNILNGDFQDKLETYMSDHIMGRDFFVGVEAYYSNIMGKNSLQDIYKAKDGYLVNAPKDLPEKGETDHFEKNLVNMETFTLTNAIDSTLMIVPSAGYVMEDKLPSFHKKYNDDKLIVKAAKETPSVKFLDLRQTLFDAYKSGKDIYYHTDHHLTSCGSYEIYKAYCEFNGLSYPSEEDYTVTTHGGFYGTTYSGSGYWLTDPDELEVWDLGEEVTVTLEEDGEVSDTMFFEKHLDQKDKYPIYLDGNHSYVKIENPKAKGGTLLVIRDSYGQNFVPFLSHNYKKIYMLDMRYYRKSLAEMLGGEKIDEILYLYGIDTLITDSSTSYLFF